MPLLTELDIGLGLDSTIMPHLTALRLALAADATNHWTGQIERRRTLFYLKRDKPKLRGSALDLGDYERFYEKISHYHLRVASCWLREFA
jgi:hypothetical protein